MNRAAFIVILLALLLTACGINQPDALGRYPVTLVVVEHLESGPLGPAGVAARVTAPDRIVVEREWCRREDVIAHELRHIVQWNETGGDYLIVYALQVITYGYWDAPFEVEAREAVFLTFYRYWARDLIATLDEGGGP